MNICSGLNTVSSMYRQPKGNNMKAPVSAEKTFYTAETPKVYQIFTTDNMLWTGDNGTGLSYCLKYADDSTDENPVVLAKGVDENGKEFEQRIYINDVNPSNATVVEMRLQMNLTAGESFFPVPSLNRYKRQETSAWGS